MRNVFPKYSQRDWQFNIFDSIVSTGGTLMEKIIIKGGHRLAGRVRVAGAKNAALPIQAAAILASSGNVILSNVPLLPDVTIMNQLLHFLNLKVVFDEAKNKLTIDAASPVSSATSQEYTSQMRASMVVLGPLLARTGHARIALPTDYSIASHSIALLLGSLRQLGAVVEQHDDYLDVRAEQLVGTRLKLAFPSVGATESIMMAATLASGITTIENAAQEPEIVDLAVMLNKMGARVHGAGTDIIRIQGVNFLHGCEHSIIPDRIEAGIYMIAAAVTNGDVIVEGSLPQYNESLLAKLEEMGVTVIRQDDGIRIFGTSVLIPANSHAQAYPGFPVALQPPLAVLQLLANGKSRVDETIFEKKLTYLDELRKMNASFEVNGALATLNGPASFTGAEVIATDIRSGLALILAGLMADGITQVQNLKYIDREYDQFVPKLRQLGAQIDRVDVDK